MGKTKFNIIFYFWRIVITVAFSLGFLYVYQNYPLDNDITIYNNFISHFPNLYSTDEYGFYSVLYLPYFYWIYFPISKMDPLFAYILVCSINFLSLQVCLFIADKKDNKFRLVSYSIFTLSAYSLGKWANFELIICAIYFTLLVGLNANDKGKTVKVILVALIFSLWGFKFISFMFGYLILSKLDKYQRLLFFCTLIFSQIILNLFFIICSPYLLDILFILSILKNTVDIPLFSLLFRTSFSIPLICMVIDSFSRLLDKTKFKSHFNEKKLLDNSLQA